MKVTHDQLVLFYEAMMKQDEGDINEAEKAEKAEKVEGSNDEAECCLISNMPLDNNAVELECGHKFNYLPLYYDLVNHKNKFNTMEKHMLKHNEIRCPYCRNIQKKLMPYKELPNVEKIHGVNYVDELKLLSKFEGWMKGTCAFQTTIHVNSILNVVVCPNKYVNFIPGLDKYICALHHSTAIKEYKLAKKLEEKKKIQEEKKKIQEEKKNKKEAEKQKIKEEKEKAKENAKISGATSAATSAATSVVNHVIQSSSSTQLFCTQIFVSGKNKGKPCGYKSHENGLCKRHYGLSMKKNGQTQQPEPDVKSESSS